MEGGVKQLTAWRPNPVYLKDAKNIEVFETNPTDKVKKRLAEVESGKDLTLQENQTDACVARLVTALGYLAKRRSQNQQQLVGAK